jgi:hypothetical protein
MGRRLCLSIALAAALMLLAAPVIAGYYTYLLVTESNGTDYTKLALNMSLNITYLVEEGYITSSGLDTRVTDSGYTVLPHMLAEDKVLWVSDLEGNKATQFIFFTQQDAMESFPVITGHGGYVTVNDTAALEPGGIFAFVVLAYVDTSAGAGKNIIRKDGALTFNVSAAQELTFNITGGNSLVASGVSSGYKEIYIISDGIELSMEINGSIASNTTASIVPNTGNDWVLFENDVCPYIYYYGEWVA